MRFLIIICVTFICNCSSTNDSSYTFHSFEVSELKEDLQSLYQKLDSTHYNLYHKHSKEEFDQVYKSLYDGITSPMNSMEFYQHLLPLYNLLSDAHSTLIFPFSYSTAYAEQGGLFLPLKLFVKNNDIYVKGNYSKSDIPLYSKIISINTIDTKQLLQDVGDLANYELVEAEDDYKAYFLPRMLFPLYGFDKKYDIELLTPNDKKITKSVEGIHLDSIPRMNKPYYDFYTIDDSIGVLDLNLCEGKNEFGHFCDSIFSYLNNNSYPYLIIDVRDNGGGSTMLGDTLLTYLTDKKFTQYPKVKIKRSSQMDPDVDSIQFITYDDDVERSFNNPNIFSGNTFMIANNNTFSSASLLSATFKCYNLGKLVGEKTGGVQVFYDEPIMHELKNTGLKFLVSHQLRWCPCGESMHEGIIPDYQVAWNYDHVLNGIDSEIAFIKNLIGKKE